MDGVAEPMCCIGCKAACEAILANGLIDFYSLRNDFSETRQLNAQDAHYLEQFDDAVFLDEICTQASNELSEASFAIHGITCPACCWLVEKYLEKNSVLEAFSLNYTNATLVLRFNPKVCSLKSIAVGLLDFGFYLQVSSDETQPRQQKSNIKKLSSLVVAGFGMAQVMMFALPEYLDVWGEMSPDVDYLMSWFSALVTTLVVFVSGPVFFTSALQAVSHMRVNMDVPITVAIVAAYSSSLLSLFTGVGEFYFDSICMLIFLLLLSRYIQSRGLSRSAINIFNLYSLIPKSAHRFNAGVLNTVKLSELLVGDLILIKPGETVPVDVTLEESMASISTAHLSGESVAIQKSHGQVVPAGSLNLNHPIKAKVISVGKDTSLAKMIRLVEWAQGQKPTIATLANRLAAYFTFIVCAIAFITYVTGTLLSVADPFARMIAVLVVSCPCALSLATPAVVSAAISALLGEGVLLRNADALERLNDVDTLVLDKTGTLTSTKLTVTSLVALEQGNQAELFAIASALEEHSEHAIAAAFPSSPLNADKVNNHPGLGLSGFVDGKKYYLGSRTLIESQGILVPTALSSHLHIFLASECKTLAAIVIDESINPGAAALIETAADLKVNSYLVSGDQSSRVKKIAETLHIDSYQAETLPSDKMRLVQKLQNKGAVVAMLGDGVNDAPVLACADVSIAMGTGTDIAKQESDLILMNSDLSRLAKAMHVAKKANSILKQNVAWALLYNLTAIPFAVAGIITPWVAAIGMSVSSLVVVMNALRLRAI